MAAVKINKKSGASLTAKEFIDQLTSQKSPIELKKNQRFYVERGGDKCLGVRMKTIFDSAKASTAMPLAEVEKLFKSPYFEVRMGAVSILDFKARHKKTTQGEKEALFKLYIKCHDRINNWDMVDRSAPFVVGGHLFDKPRNVLYKLAKSKNPWERRTAIVATYYFIRQHQVNDTFEIAEILANDSNEFVQKAVGSWVRFAGQQDKQMLIGFLDKHAATMARVALRYAIEKLDKKEREFYLKKK